MPIHHDMNIQDMVYMGQKIEQSVLIKAITAHTEHKFSLIIKKQSYSNHRINNFII